MVLLVNHWLAGESLRILFSVDTKDQYIQFPASNPRLSSGSKYINLSQSGTNNRSPEDIFYIL